MRRCLSILLAAAAALGFTAHAQIPPAPAAFYATVSNAYPSGSKCLAFGENGGDRYPSRVIWGPGPFCGFEAGLSALMANRQAVWKFVHLQYDQYMITNASSSSEQCLFFDSVGTAVSGG